MRVLGLEFAACAVINQRVWIVILLFIKPNEALHLRLPPADGVAVTKLSPQSIRVYWTLPARHPDNHIAFTRVTLSPRFDRYRIMEDFPVPEYSATFNGLRHGVYDVSVQSGGDDGEVGEKGPMIELHMQPLLLSVGQNETVDWSRDPSGLPYTPATEEIVIVCVCVLFWIIAILWFFAKWAKIRVIEPRYFDYKFLMRYDKAFALRNTLISAAASSTAARRSIGGRSMVGGADHPRYSFSAASMRNAGCGGGVTALVDEYDELSPTAAIFHAAAAVTAARRPSCLPVRHYNHRPSQDVRIHLNELFEMHDGRLKLARDSICSV